MQRRLVLAMLGLVGLVPPLRGWAEERGRAWQPPRVERGWILADNDR